MSELTDKELVQLLSDMAEGDLAEGAEVVDHPAYIAAYRITQLRASPWISVDDRLPEVGAVVIVGCQNRGTIILAKYLKEGFTVYPQSSVSHWMPAPKLPPPTGEG